jgi:hypothetical protein
VLKLEQKHGTSRDSPRYKDATSFKTVERLSVPVIYFGYCAGIHSEPALGECVIFT